LIRQVLGAITQFEKAMVVGKLKGARDRKRREVERGEQHGRRAATGRAKVEGRQNYAERCPEVVTLARELRRQKGRRPLSLRKVSAELAAKGFLATSGKPYGAGAVARMIG